MSSLALLVRGRAIDTYRHNDKTYVEGRKGTPYEIQFYNSSPERRKIIVSVDGLNITTGDKTWDQGYIVEPYQTATIPGWRKSGTNTAEFEFSSLKGSYNQHNISGEASSVGVIGCKVYSEKVKPVPKPVEHHYYHHHSPIYYYPYYWNGYPYWGGGCGVIQNQNTTY